MTTARLASRLAASPRRHAARGMTLVELMIVVIIIGILAGLAAVGYSTYIKRSRASEASTQLAAIAVREAAYRAEFNTYMSAGRATVPTAVGVTNAWPTASPTVGAADWYTSLPTEWSQLGVRPSRPVWFRYVVLAGQPSATPPGEPGYASSPNQDVWFVAEAYGDLDRDGTNSQFHQFSGGPITVLNNADTE